MLAKPERQLRELLDRSMPAAAEIEADFEHLLERASRRSRPSAALFLTGLLAALMTAAVLVWPPVPPAPSPDLPAAGTTTIQIRSLDRPEARPMVIRIRLYEEP